MRKETVLTSHAPQPLLTLQPPQSPPWNRIHRCDRSNRNPNRKRKPSPNRTRNRNRDHNRSQHSSSTSPCQQEAETTAAEAASPRTANSGPAASSNSNYWTCWCTTAACRTWRVAAGRRTTGGCNWNPLWKPNPNPFTSNPTIDRQIQESTNAV